MESAETLEWFLRKHEDGNIFGPLSFAQLARWASSAQVAPNDVVSSDQVTWVKAPMLAELGMDWLVEVTTERFYGPTTLGAIQEFVRLGEINADTFVINSCDGERRRGNEKPLVPSPGAGADGTNEGPASQPSPTSVSIKLEER